MKGLLYLHRTAQVMNNFATNHISLVVLGLTFQADILRVLELYERQARDLRTC